MITLHWRLFPLTLFYYTLTSSSIQTIPPTNTTVSIPTLRCCTLGSLTSDCIALTPHDLQIYPSIYQCSIIAKLHILTYVRRTLVYTTWFTYDPSSIAALAVDSSRSRIHCFVSDYGITIQGISIPATTGIHIPTFSCLQHHNVMA